MLGRPDFLIARPQASIRGTSADHGVAAKPHNPMIDKITKRQLVLPVVDNFLGDHRV